MNSIEKLQKLCVITSGIRLWTGETVLKPEDIHLGQGGSLPPAQLASLGRLAIVPKQTMGKIITARNSFNYLMEKNAVPFLGGYAISVDQYKAIQPELDAAITALQTAINDFVSGYDAALEQWKADNPTYAASIARDALTAEQVRGRFGASYTVTRVMPLGDEESPEVAKAVEGIYGKLVREISLNAKNRLKNYRAKAEKSFMQSVKDTLRSFKTKLHSLSFINPKLGNFIAAIDKIIAGLPDQGKITGDDYIKLLSFFQLMANQTMIFELFDGSLDLDGYLAQAVADYKAATSPDPIGTSLNASAVSQTGDLHHVEDAEPKIAAVAFSNEDASGADFFNEEAAPADAPASVAAEAVNPAETVAVVPSAKPETAVPKKQDEVEPEPLENWWF
jgi:hypothetical protein